MSLRARLLLGLVVLAALGLLAMAIATYEEQRSFLFARVDQQVSASTFVVGGELGVVRGLPGGSPSTSQAAAGSRGDHVPGIRDVR